MQRIFLAGQLALRPVVMSAQMLGLTYRTLARPSRLISLPRHSFFPFSTRTMANAPTDFVCRVIRSRQPVAPHMEFRRCSFVFSGGVASVTYPRL